MKDQEKARKWNPAEICNIATQKGIDHPQYGRLSYTVLTVQKRDSIVQVEVDTVVVNPEQPIDLDTLEPEKLILVLSIHCHVSPMLTFTIFSGYPAAFTTPPCLEGSEGRNQISSGSSVYSSITESRICWRLGSAVSSSRPSYDK